MAADFFTKIHANLVFQACILFWGVSYGRHTVSRVLFRRRELTEPHWVWGQTRWVLRETRRVRLHTNNRLRGTHWVLSPELGEGKKTHRVRCLNSCSPKPYSACLRFQDTWHSNKQNPSAYWHATLSCPLLASNYANLYLVPISFQSRSGWPFLGLLLRTPKKPNFEEI